MELVDEDDDHGPLHGPAQGVLRLGEHLVLMIGDAEQIQVPGVLLDPHGLLRMREGLLETLRILLQQKGPDEFLIDATCAVEEVIEELEVDLPKTDATTIGGLIIERIGRIPVAGEKLQLHAHSITIQEAEPMRIRMILLQRGRSESKSEDGDRSTEERQ